MKEFIEKLRVMTPDIFAEEDVNKRIANFFKIPIPEEKPVKIKKELLDYDAKLLTDTLWVPCYCTLPGEHKQIEVEVIPNGARRVFPRMQFAMQIIGTAATKHVTIGGYYYPQPQREVLFYRGLAFKLTISGEYAVSPGAPWLEAGIGLNRFTTHGKWADGTEWKGEKIEIFWLWATDRVGEPDMHVHLKTYIW